GTRAKPVSFRSRDRRSALGCSERSPSCPLRQKICAQKRLTATSVRNELGRSAKASDQLSARILPSTRRIFGQSPRKGGTPEMANTMMTKWNETNELAP